MLQAFPSASVRIVGLLQLTLLAGLLGSVPAARAASIAKTSNVAEGRSAFHANCAPCHGLSARGGARGPDLTAGNWAHGGSDTQISHTITHGVAGTEMPANAFDDAEVRAIIAYLRSLSPPANPLVGGDPIRGQQMFVGSAGCVNCHMVDGHGGHLGPDLSRVGTARAVPYLIDSIREPDKELTGGAPDPNNHYGLPLPYDTVTVTTTAGERLVGVARNEDTFSIQLLAVDQSLHCLLKSETREVIHERRSLMPAYPVSALGTPQLLDLVAYLVSLGRDRAVAVGQSR